MASAKALVAKILILKTGMNKSKMENWIKIWDAAIHTTEHAAKRIKSAKSAELTPIKIDKKEMYGYFRGSHGHYETWLNECSCNDFRRYKLPCKHIYRLAIELGFLNEKAVTDANLIPQAKNQKASLPETIDIVETLSEYAQRTLGDIARNTNSANPEIRVNSNDEINELLQSGLLVRVGCNVQEKINFGLKKEIAQLLISHGISFSKSAKKSDLERICLSRIPDEAKKHFGIICSFNVRIPDCFSRQNIHYYLHRKYDFSDCVDEEANSLPLIRATLPDDAVTGELIKRGYYRPDDIENQDKNIEAGRIAVKLSRT